MPLDVNCDIVSKKVSPDEDNHEADLLLCGYHFSLHWKGGISPKGLCLIALKKKKSIIKTEREDYSILVESGEITQWIK